MLDFIFYVVEDGIVMFIINWVEKKNVMIYVMFGEFI